MRKRMYCLAVLCLLLSGCAGMGRPVYPETAADGGAWDETWLMHSNVLGIGEADGISLMENYAVLTMEGITASVWAVGTPVLSADENGEGTELYPAQIYVLVMECADVQAAEDMLFDWTAQLEENWSVLDTRDAVYNGQMYTIRDCASVHADSPFGRELCALTRFGANAVSVELDCRDWFSGQAETVLSGFLEACHYNAALEM